MNKKTNIIQRGKTISEEELLLKKIEKESLLFETDALLRDKSVDKEIEKYQLQNGTEFTIRELNNIISEAASEYIAMFPNSKPFFKLMFKLNDWKDLDPNKFIKPPICAVYIKRYIYGRFQKEVLETLLKIENPILIGYIKKYKLFQFLNDEGKIMLEGFINEAIEVMEESENWYDFEKKYTTLYNLSLQTKMFTNQK